jgi:hypothetical protein
MLLILMRKPTTTSQVFHVTDTRADPSFPKDIRTSLSSHYSILARWRSSRRRIDLITTVVRIRWLLKFSCTSLLTAVITLVGSLSLALIVVATSLTLLVAVLRLFLSLVLILRVIGGSSVTWRRIAHPSSTVEWLQASLAAATSGKTAGNELETSSSTSLMKHVPEQEEEQDECDHNHTEEDPSSPSTPRGITRVIAS